jgi:hypothetical protein
MNDDENEVNDLFSRILEECRTKNTVHSYAKKISVVCGVFQDEQFIQREGAAQATKLPEDLRHTLLNEVKSIDDAESLLRLIVRICKFLQDIQFTYQNLRESIRKFSSTMDKLSREELVDSNPGETIGFAKGIVDVAYQFECERLVTVRVSGDLLILCERRLPKVRRFSSRVEREVDMQMTTIDQLSNEVKDIEKELKTSLKTLIRDYESQYMIHPYDMDLDAESSYVSKSQSSEFESSDDEDLSRYRQKASSRSSKPKKASKNRSNDDGHQYASKKRKYDDDEQLVENVRESIHHSGRHVSEYSRGTAATHSRKAIANDKRSSRHADGWTPVCRNNRKSSWKGIFPGELASSDHRANAQGSSASRFEIQYKDDEFRVVEDSLRKLTHPRTMMDNDSTSSSSNHPSGSGMFDRGSSSSLGSCSNSMEIDMDATADDSAVNNDMHDLQLPTEPKSDLFNSKSSAKKTIIGQFLEFLSSRPQTLKLLSADHAIDDDLLLHMNYSNVQRESVLSSPLYGSLYVNSSASKLEIESAFIDFSCHISTILERIHRSSDKLSSQDYSSILQMHSNAMRLLHSPFIKCEPSKDVIDALARTWFAWKSDILPSFLESYLKEKSLLQQISRMEEDGQGDMLLCLVFDSYYQMCLIVKHMISKINKSDQNHQLENIRFECIQLLSSLFYDIFLIGVVQSKLSNLCLLSIMSDIPSKGATIINYQSNTSLLLFLNPDLRLARFTRALAYIQLYATLANTLTDVEVEHDHASNPRLDRGKLVEKLAWKSYNNNIRAAMSGLQLEDQPTILSIQSAYIIVSGRTGRRLIRDERQLWTSLCLHAATLQSYVLPTNPDAKIMQNNWPLIKYVLAAFMEDMVSSSSSKLEYAADSGINNYIDLALNRIPCLIKIWSNPEKGLEILLDLLHHVIKQSSRRGGAATSMVPVTIVDLKASHFMEACLDMMENSAPTGSESERNFLVSMKKSFSRSTAVVSSLLRKLCKTDEVVSTDQLDLLLGSLLSSHSQSLFAEADHISMMKELSSAFEMSMNSYILIISSLTADQAVRARRKLRLSIVTAIEKIIHELRKVGSDLSGLTSILRLMSIAIDVLGVDTFEPSTADCLYKNAMLKKILDVPINSYSVDAKASVDLTCNIFFAVFVYGPFNHRFGSSAASNSAADPDFFIAALLSRTNAFMRWASTFFAYQKDNAFLIFLMSKQQHHLFIISSLCQTLKNIKCAYDLAKVGNTVSSENQDMLLSAAVELISLIVQISALTLSTMEKLSYPKLLYAVVTASSMSITVAMALFKTPTALRLSVAHHELLRVCQVQCKNYTSTLRSTAMTIQGANKVSDDDTIFVMQYQSGSIANAFSLTAIERQKLLEITANAICNTIMLQELLSQYFHLTHSSSEQTLKDLLSVASLPPQLTVFSSTKASDLWLQGCLSNNLIQAMIDSSFLEESSTHARFFDSFINVMGRSTTMSFLAMSLASAIYPRAIAAYDPGSCLRNLANFMDKLSYYSQSHTRSPHQLLWSYVLHNTGSDSSLAASNIVNSMVHSLTKYRRLWNGQATLILNDPTSYQAKTDLEYSVICRLAMSSTVEVIAFYKELMREIANYVSRTMNHVKLCYTKNLQSVNDAYEKTVPNIIAIMMYSCSEWNCDMTNQLMKELLKPYLGNLTKDHDKENFKASAAPKCSRMMLQTVHLLPLFIRTISTTPFTSTCTNWNVLLSLLFVAALKRFRSSDDMRFYQIMLTIWSFSLSISANSDFSSLMMYLQARKLIAVDLSLYDPSFFQLIEGSVHTTSQSLCETIEDAGSHVLHHPYAGEISMLQYRNYLLLSSKPSDQCWTEASIDFLKLNDSVQSGKMILRYSL